jgi:hypothetical protein
MTMISIGAVLRHKHQDDKEPIHWIGVVPTKCQLSGRRITKRFVDGRVPGHTSWAIVDPVYFHTIGGTLGMGCGQLYERQQTGRWLKIGG